MATKVSASTEWLVYLAAASLVLFTTALSVDKFNAHTIFQLWPYYMAPYFVAFSTGLRYFDLPRIMLEPFCRSDDNLKVGTSEDGTSTIINKIAKA